MNQIKRYLYSNLYLFLPGVLIFVFAPLLFALIEPYWIRFSTSNFPACDFSAGGGSRNLCENDIWFSTLLSALGIAAPLAFLVTVGLNRSLQIGWLSPVFGIVLFFGIPLIFFLVHIVFTTGIYGEARGKINDIILTIGIPVWVVVLAIASFINYQRFSEKEISAP